MATESAALRDKLKFINDAFIGAEFKDRSAFMAGDLTLSGTTFTADNATEAIAASLLNGYTTLKTNHSSYLPSSTGSSLHSAITSIRWRDPTAPTSAMASNVGFATAAPYAISPPLPTGFVDFYMAPVIPSTAGAPLIQLLSDLTVVFSLLSDVNYANFINPSIGKTIKLGTYYATGSGTSTTTETTFTYAAGTGYSGTINGSSVALTDVLQRIFGVANIANFGNDTNLFVVRRMVLLWIMMIHFYIALKIFEDTNPAPTGSPPAISTDAQKAKHLLDATMNNLRYLNQYAMGAGTGATDAGSIDNSVSARIRLYNDLGNSLSEMDATFRDRQSVLKTEVEGLKSAKDNESRSKMFLITTLVILGTVAVVGAIALFLPISETYKYGLSGAAILIALVSAVVIHRSYGSKVEDFAIFNDILSAYSSAAGGITAATYASAYDTVFKREVQEYLAHTIRLGSLLKTDRAFREVNYGMFKQFVFYDNSSRQISTKTQEVRQVAKVYQLDRAYQRAWITFTLTMMILISVVLFGFLATRERFQGLRPWIVGVAVVVVVLALAAYVMDTSARVRTESRHRYWAQPSSVM